MFESRRDNLSCSTPWLQCQALCMQRIQSCSLNLWRVRMLDLASFDGNELPCLSHSYTFI